MHFKRMLPKLSIRNKLLLLNVMICLAFLVIAGVVLFSLALIRDMSTEVTKKDMERVVSNSRTVRELSGLFADIDLLSLTFYGRNDGLKSEGGRLVGIMKDVLKSTAGSDNKEPFLALSERFGSFLYQCNEVNTALHACESIDRKTDADLTKLEDIISKLLVKLTLEGKDTAFAEQLLALSTGYRESLLQIGRLFVQLGPEHYFKPLKENIAPVISAIANLYLRLHTLTASIPEVAKYANKIINDLQEYKEAILGFHSEMEELSSRIKDLDHCRALVMSTMENIDNGIYKTTRLVSDSIEKIILSTGAVIFLLSLVVIVALIFATAYLIKSTINNPMRSIQKDIESFGKGNLDTRIQLGRKDEWDLIEKTFNNMAADLLSSYSALRQSEEKYRTIIEDIEDGYYEVDIAGNFTFFNDSLRKILGYSNNELMGMNNRRYTDEENAKKLYQVFNRVYTTGKPDKGYSWTIIRKDGTKRSVEASVSLRKGAEGEPIGFRGVVRDISEKQRLATRLRQAQKMEAIATLAGGIAHEFNNALMGILGNIELLKMNLPEDGKREDYLEAMRGSGHRMSRLTDQLLAYARGGRYQPTNLRLDEFVIQTVPILQHDLNPAVRVETHFGKNISYIKADHPQMQMVLSAIMANSNEAIEDDGFIRITAENEVIDVNFIEQHPGLKPGPYVCLTIEDDGQGMDAETRNCIFEPFFTTKFQGRGMGMAAVYGIVMNHDGWISVDSELGKGTAVRIYLPVRKKEVEKPRTPETEIVKGTGTILMIEDEDVVIEVTQAMLEWLGYRVMVAKTGKDAVHIAETFDGNIDLALLDIKLPDMEGGKVYSLIMKARPDLKVIVCSGYSIEGPARKILDAGAEDFIQKPFSLATLSEKLKEVIEGR